jgi:hypothetical protein
MAVLPLWVVVMGIIFFFALSSHYKIPSSGTVSVNILFGGGGRENCAPKSVCAGVKTCAMIRSHEIFR